jgi:hypothetical protein
LFFTRVNRGLLIIFISSNDFIYKSGQLAVVNFDHLPWIHSLLYPFPILFLIQFHVYDIAVNPTHYYDHYLIGYVAIRDRVYSV